MVGVGVFFTAVTLWGFAARANQLLFWRIANGIAAASVYVDGGALARWFLPHEWVLSERLPP
jgi:hypothetical protein